MKKVLLKTFRCLLLSHNGSPQKPAGKSPNTPNERVPDNDILSGKSKFIVWFGWDKKRSLRSNAFILFLLFTIVFANKALADYTIDSGMVVDPASTPALLNTTGTISIYGTLAVNSNVTFTSSEPLTILIYGSSGQIYWYANKTLALPEGSIIRFVNNPTAPPGMRPTSGSASQILKIGGIKYAAANDNSNNVVFSFTQMNSIGGTASVSAFLNSSTICYGSSAALSASLVIPSGVSFYINWNIISGSGSISNNNTSSDSNTVLTGLSVGSDTVACNLYSNSGSGSYYLVSTDSLIITVSQKPSTPTINADGPTVFCEGGSVTLTSSSGNTYLWSTGATSASIDPVTSGTYTVRVGNSQGCLSDTSNAITVAVTAMPSATISYPGTPYCSGSGNVSVTMSGSLGGTFASTTGLTINESTGEINTTSSTPGTFMVTYTIAPSGGCLQFQATASLTIASPGTWLGAVNTDWNNNGNWNCGEIPTDTTNVTIPNGLTNYPVLNVGTGHADNLTIQNGASLAVSGGTILVSGTISNSGMLDVSEGTLEMDGKLSQTIPAGTLENNALNNLIINNTSTGGVNLGGTLDIYGSLSFGGTGMIFNTNNYLTLKSSASATAYVGNTTENTINGSVTVERYISARKAWRFLSIPTNTTQTIQEAWQEGCGANVNCVPGYGTQITGSGGITGGFDVYTSSPSLKTFNASTDSWTGVVNTNATEFNSELGYMIFIRGDRSVISSFASPTSTILRTKGTLNTGDRPVINIPANEIYAVGNPYASSIDLRNITRTGLKDFFYVWDPQLTDSTGYGGYQTFSNDGDGNYVVTPGGGSYGTNGSISNYIQSGQAFFVQSSSTGGSITFKEDAKTSGSSLVSTPASTPIAQFTGSLYGIDANGNSYMADGFLANYGDDYSNNVDDMDAVKLMNVSENLALKRDNVLLVIERRHTISGPDTLFLNLTNTRVQKYYFQFTSSQLYQPGLTGYLFDSYLNTKTPLHIDGSTVINFTITDTAGSKAANRFMIIFRFETTGTLPLTFTSLSAHSEDGNIVVDWNVQNEMNINRYFLEKSADGSSFSTLSVTSPKNNNDGSAEYEVTDTEPFQGYNYYRVKSTDVSDKTSYTGIVKVFLENKSQQITIYPNPLADGMINILFGNQPTGIYQVRLLTQNGMVLFYKQIDHSEESTSESIRLDKYLSQGMYILEITNPMGQKTILNVIRSN